MKVKVVQKQANGKKCIVCGLKNEFGLKSEFYELENGELLSLCKTGPSYLFVGMTCKFTGLFQYPSI